MGFLRQSESPTTLRLRGKLQMATCLSSTLRKCLGISCTILASQLTHVRFASLAQNLSKLATYIMPSSCQAKPQFNTDVELLPK